MRKMLSNPIKTKDIKITGFTVATLFVIFLLIFSSGKSVKANSPKRPNVILISIETTRADHLSCYGYERETSPTIDELASEGALFLNMFVQRGITWPSLTSIMTSLYPVNHGVRRNGDMLSPSVISLAEILKKKEYVCAAFLSCGGGAVWRGFDHLIKEQGQDKKITRAAIRWLKNNSKREFFLWVHYFQPHKPYQPPKPYDSIFDPSYAGELDGSYKQLDEITLKKIKLNESDLNHIISLYDGSILFIDDQIKQILTVLKDTGEEKNTLIIITADHGEDLYDHNFYFYHAASIYDSSLHVPLIIRLPNKSPKNMVIPEVVEGIDIAPTILELVNIPIPHYFEGKSLAPLIFSKNRANAYLYAYSEWKDKILSIRTDRYRYIFNPTEHHPKTIKGATEDTYIIAREELYDIINDPKESDNMATKEPNIARRLRTKLENWNNFERWLGNYDLEEKEIPEEVRERLKSLGYVQ